MNIKPEDKLKQYVCPRCYHRIENCTCEGERLPDYLMQIDSEIQEHVRILNKKGYRTSSSCESHNQNGNIGLCFVFKHGFGDVLPLPKDFKATKHNAVIYLYDRNITDEEFEKQKKLHLDYLLEWCKDLPEAENRQDCWN